MEPKLAYRPSFCIPSIFHEQEEEVGHDQAVQRGNRHRQALRGNEHPGDSGKYQRTGKGDGTGHDSGPHPPERPGTSGRGPEVRYRGICDMLLPVI